MSTELENNSNLNLKSKEKNLMINFNDVLKKVYPEGEYPAKVSGVRYNEEFEQFSICYRLKKDNALVYENLPSKMFWKLKTFAKLADIPMDQEFDSKADMAAELESRLADIEVLVQTKQYTNRKGLTRNDWSLSPIPTSSLQFEQLRIEELMLDNPV